MLSRGAFGSFLIVFNFSIIFDFVIGLLISSDYSNVGIHSLASLSFFSLSASSSSSALVLTVCTEIIW